MCVYRVGEVEVRVCVYGGGSKRERMGVVCMHV